MKLIWLWTLIFGLAIYSCKQTSPSEQKESTELTIPADSPLDSKDEEEIEKLIRQMRIWSDSNNYSSSPIPMLTDDKDSLFVGIDHEHHKRKMQELKSSNIFSAEFIDNYNLIVDTLAQRFKDGYYEQWYVGEYPPFPFANGENPWCSCQGDFGDESYNLEIIKKDSERAELKYARDTSSSWRDIKIRVVKENGKWKIAYLQGFDFKEATLKTDQ
jgi:hypothetical protein